MSLVRGKGSSGGGSSRPAVGRSRPASGGGGGFKFNYKPRSAEEVRERAQRSIGGRDGVWKSEVQLFTPREGQNTVRILPPPSVKEGFTKVVDGVARNAQEHYGLGFFTHYGIGPDNNSYMCLKKARDEECAVCEARAEASANSEDEMAKELRPVERVAFYVIDRSAENRGPVIWNISAGQDKDITKLVIDPTDGSVILPDHPEDGYDLTFTCEGTGMKRKLKSYAFARRSSPLSDDDDKANAWLKHITENPVDEMLQFFDNEHIAKALEGQAPAKSEEERLQEEQERDVGRGGAGKGRGEERSPASTSRPRIASRRPEPEPEPQQGAGGEEEQMPTWEQLQEFTEDDLAQLGEDMQLEFPKDGFESLDDLRGWLAKELQIEVPSEEPEPTPATAKNKASWKDKLKNLGGKK